MELPGGNRGNKYHARKTEVDGEQFPSRREARRWAELRLLEAHGKISGLYRQVPFRMEVNGHPICVYRADFVYHENGHRVVEDCKGVRTREYVIKKKLLFATTGIEIRET